MTTGGAPSSGCLLWDSGHFGNSRPAKTFFLAPCYRSEALRAQCAAGPTLRPAAPPAARHLSGEARRSRNRGPAASLARRGSPGPLRERRAASAVRNMSAPTTRKTGASRDASAKPHGRRPNYCNARPFNSCTAETLSNGLLRLCRVVLLFTSYCRNILLQHKPSVVLSDPGFCRQRDKCAQLVNHQPLLHHLLL